MNYSTEQRNRWMLASIFFLSFLLMCVSCAYSQKKNSVKKYEYSWDSLKKVPVPKWFDDAKFGIFIHWGPYSVIGYKKGGAGYAEHVPKLLYDDSEHY